MIKTSANSSELTGFAAFCFIQVPPNHPAGGMRTGVVWHLPRYSSTRGPNCARLVNSIAGLLLRARSSGAFESLTKVAACFGLPAESTTGGGTLGAPTPVQKLSARSMPSVD